MGLFTLAKEIMMLFGGNEFLPAKGSLQIISLLVVITSIGSWQINQILLPNRKEKLAFKIQSLAAIISISLNIILIPKFSYMGAASAWVVTEFILTIIEAIFIRLKIKDLKINYFNKSMIKYLISVVIMSDAVLFIKTILSNHILIILISVILAPIIYFGSILILKDEIIIEFISEIKSKFIKK